MRFEKVGFVCGLGLALVASACGITGDLQNDGGQNEGAGCRGLTEAACRARTGCAVEHLGTCGCQTLVVCYDPVHESRPVCLAGICVPPPPPCGQVTTKDTCEARSDCHSVFVDPHDCACAALGCCAQWSRCADGDKANCEPPASFGCAIAQPYCEGPFVVSHTSDCYEGCAQSTDCAPQ